MGKGKTGSAAELIQKAVRDLGGDPAALAKELRRVADEAEAEALEMGLTTAQMVDDPGLIAIEQIVARQSDVAGEAAARQVQHALEAIRDQIRILRSSGDAADVALAARLEGERFSMLVSGRLIAAEEKSLEAARGVSANTPDAKAALSRTIHDIMSRAIKDIREVEHNLWTNIGKNWKQGATGDPVSILNAYDNFIAKNVGTEFGEGWARQVDSTTRAFLALARKGGRQSYVDLQAFRSHVLEQMREASGKGRTQLANLYGELAGGVGPDDTATGALEALSNLRSTATGKPVSGAAFDKAREFTRRLHDVWDGTFGARAVGPKGEALGPSGIAPELLSQRAFAAGPEATSIRLLELQDAVSFLGRQGRGTPEQAQHLAKLIETQEELVRLAALGSVDPTTQLPSVTHLRKWLANNGSLLGLFPEVRAAMETAASSKASFDKWHKLAQGTSTRWLAGDPAPTSPLARLLGVEDPTKAVGDVLRGDNPVRSFNAMMRRLRGAPGEGPGRARVDAGVRGAIWDDLSGRAMDSSGVLSLAKFRTLLFGPVSSGRGAPSVANIMENHGLLSADEVKLLERLMDHVARVETSMKAAGDARVLLKDIHTPEIINLMLTMVSSGKAGAMTKQISGGSGALAAQSRAASAARRAWDRVFNRSGQKGLLGILTGAARDPRVAAALLERPTTPSEALAASRRIHAYVLQMPINPSLTSDMVRERETNPLFQRD